MLTRGSCGVSLILALPCRCPRSAFCIECFMLLGLTFVILSASSVIKLSMLQVDPNTSAVQSLWHCTATQML